MEKCPRMPVSCQRILVLLFGIIILAASSSLAQTAPPSEIIVGAITSSQALRDGVEIQAGSAMLRITALRDDIVRVRISPGALPEDASWAVLSGARRKSIDVKPTQ